MIFPRDAPECGGAVRFGGATSVLDNGGDMLQAASFETVEAFVGGLGGIIRV